jgi:hypothetical protein
MKTAIGRRCRVLGALLLGAALLPRAADALVLDDRGEMRLGLRAYTAVRIGTEKMGGEDDPLTFPSSAAGHVRQHRYFLELKLDHDIRRLATETYGIGALFGWLDPTDLSYSLQYRGEGEGIYDYGPREFSEQADKLRAVRLDTPELPILGLSRSLPEPLIRRRIRKLRRIARQRHRLFTAYLDFEKGPLFVRVGRQVLAWGETDVFRLLDNINPLDDSFGGFFIPLDERRLPLEMARASWHFGSFGPFSDAFLEGFAAVGNRVSTFPGIPPGSPWEPGGLGFPNPSLRTVVDVPAREDLRGGARLVFTAHDITWTLAHYYTYLDVPGVRFRIPGAVQLPGELNPSSTARFGNEIQAIQTFPRVPISGAAMTFPLSRFYSIVRGEAAYFQNEPMNRQGRGNSANASALPGTDGYRRLVRQNNTEGGLDPFVWPGFLDFTRTAPIWGRLLERDTFNLALGLDVNRYVRWINPNQTLFFSTQFFYKHVFDSPGDLVLPVAFRNIPVAGTLPIIGNSCGPGGFGNGRPCRLRPRLIPIADDRFFQTLLISTSYSGGRIAPVLGIFYDWQGTWVAQPGVVYTRDPFRFITDFTYLTGTPGGQFGAVRDRDNVRFQVEYVF